MKHQFDPSRNETTWNMVRAGEYLIVLKSYGQIPGVNTNQHGELQSAIGLFPPKQAQYPWRTAFSSRFKDQPGIIYWYYIEIPSAESDLVIKRACKADKSGKILEDSLPLPSDEDQKKANEELRNNEELKKLREGKK